VDSAHATLGGVSGLSKIPAPATLRQLAAANTPDAQARLQRQIDATDRQIDRLVHELYGLTDEEIGIVEGSV
jgi:hypothetical protein